MAPRQDSEAGLMSIRRLPRAGVFAGAADGAGALAGSGEPKVVKVVKLEAYAHG